MTKNEAVENHRKMWTWIALETLKRKSKMEKEDYFNEIMPSLKGKIFNNCFCCNYAKQLRYSVEFCEMCPLKWPFKDCTYSTYFLWHETTSSDYEKAAIYALEIASLTERPNQEFDLFGV